MTTTRRYLTYWKESVKRFIGYLILLQLFCITLCIIFPDLILTGIYWALEMARFFLPLMIWSLFNPLILMAIERYTKFNGLFQTVVTDSETKPRVGIWECRVSFLLFILLYAVVCNSCQEIAGHLSLPGIDYLQSKIENEPLWEE